MDKKFGYFMALVTYTIICFVTFYIVFMPKIIERRMKDLNIMHYNGKFEKFVGKDDVKLNSWDLYYIQYGNLNGYEYKK